MVDVVIGLAELYAIIADMLDVMEGIKDELIVRTFLSTPLVEYTVTEGLLLCILLAIVLKSVFGFVWRCFDGF